MNELEAASTSQQDEAATEPIEAADGVRQDEGEQPVDNSFAADGGPELFDSGSELQEGEVTPEQLLIDVPIEPDEDSEVARKLAVLEAVVYVTDEPLSAEQIAKALGEPLIDVKLLLDKLVEEYNRPHHGLTVREVAGGFKITTKPEHHEAVRTFVRNLNPPLKLSLAALETLAVIAYKQPITAPEIMEIRGVQGAGVLKTLIDRKLITTAGRKNVVGKPILYKTTKEFLVQFGLRDLNELPSLKEFEDLRRMAFADAVDDGSPAADVVDGQPVAETNRDESASEQREERETEE
jgi:segregation and condensation protein B